MDNDGWVLINNKDATPIIEGFVVRSFRGVESTIAQGIGRPPTKIASAGRVWVIEPGNSMVREYYPAVYDLRWERI